MLSSEAKYNPKIMAMIILLKCLVSCKYPTTIVNKNPYFSSFSMPWRLALKLTEFTKEIKEMRISSKKRIFMGVFTILVSLLIIFFMTKAKIEKPVRIFTAAEEKLATKGMRISAKYINFLQ